MLVSGVPIMKPARSALLVIALLPQLSHALDARSRPDILTPRAGQFDLELYNMTGFTGPGSVVEVRENGIEGARLRYRDLGLDVAQLPTLIIRYWLDSRDAVSFGARDFFLSGSGFLSSPANFNGATIAGGHTIDSSPDTYSVSLFYERRFTPETLGGWDLRGRLGLEYTRLNFMIDGGNAPVAPGSQGTETKEDFFVQELPVPVVGFEAVRKLSRAWTAELSLQGDWIDDWDSLRREGGDVRLTQAGAELHARALYSDVRLGPVRPLVGVFYYYFYQYENSGEDGNRVRYSSFGPEIGLSCSL